MYAIEAILVLAANLRKTLVQFQLQIQLTTITVPYRTLQITITTRAIPQLITGNRIIAVLILHLSPTTIIIITGNMALDIVATVNGVATVIIIEKVVPWGKIQILHFIIGLSFAIPNTIIIYNNYNYD